MDRIKFKVLKTYLESLFLSQNFMRGCLFQFQLRNGLTAWKVSQCGVISGPYFPVFGMNTEIYGVNLHIHSEYRKIRTRNNFVFGHFPRSEYFNQSCKVQNLNKVRHHQILCNECRCQMEMSDGQYVSYLIWP